MKIDYEMLRKQLVEDYRERILFDEWGRYRISEDATERYGYPVSQKQARRAIEAVRAEEGEPVEEVIDRMSEDGNEREVEYATNRPTTLEEAIDALGISGDEWEIYESAPRTYEGQAKVDRIIDYEKREDGTERPITRSVLRVVTMYGFSFKIRRRVLKKSQFPVLEIARVQVSRFARPERRRGGLKCVLFVPDPLGFRRDLVTGALEPLHDRGAMSVALQIARRGNFDRITILGDWLDLAEWSPRYVRSPEFAQTTNPALAEGAWWLAQLIACAGEEADFLEGNHEKRIHDAVITHQEAAFGVRRGGRSRPRKLIR